MQLPKGVLIAVGGAEDKGSEEEKERQNSLDFFKQGILNEIVGFCGKKTEPKIEVVTTASSIPDEVAHVYKKAFKKLGCIDIGHLKITKREEADSKKILERLEKCNGILFSGGDQLRLCSVLGGTEFMDILHERYETEHFVIAGTSAGAAAMSNTMICGGDETKAYLKGKVELSIGFGFLREVIIDTHFDARGRFGRLVQAIAAQPGAVGIGLDEDTGVVIEKGTKVSAIGSSSVVVIDGTSINHNNIADIRNGMPISVANLVVHMMTHSDVFDINSRTFTGVSSPVHAH
ncbi:MAG TPA: cyanophycinase [Flavisolibacter sp.]|jgi:cyanophycinase|nr:cyanophycinase [Flavisolibacter sp.]